MSGLFGIIDSEGKSDVSLFLQQVSTKLSHFHWYVSDTWTAPNAPVGLGRSGIGILNRESQPLYSRSRKHVLFMSGELYRTGGLRKKLEEAHIMVRDSTAAELALSAFEAFGLDFAKFLDGAFFISIYDIEARRLFLVSDRMGMYPTYYMAETGKLVFAPEIKGVLSAAFVTRKLNLAAAAQYFRFQHLLENETFHEGIHRFPYGSVGEFNLSTGQWTLQRYWDWDDIPLRLEMNFDEAVEEGSRILRDTIRELSADELRPGVFLSGGLDSRTIIGFLSHYKSAPITATFGANESRDVYYAERIARAVNSRHHWFDLPDGRWVLDQVDLHLKLTEGFHHWVHMHGVTMLPQLRQMVDYNLTGWDGGTVMGHKDQIHPSMNDPADHTALLVELYQEFTRAYTWPGLTEAEEHFLYTPAAGKQMIGLAFNSMVEAFKRYEGFRKDNRAEYFYVRNHCFRLTQNMVTFIRSHIEVRFPFWDYPLIDFIYSLRPDVRGHQMLYRHIITRELPRLANIPYDKQEYLPTVNPLLHNTQAFAVKARRRLGIFPKRHTLYADYENYLRHELRGWAEGILFDQRTQERGIFDMNFMRSLMKRHVDGREEWTIGKIAPLITFEMMMRQYFD